MSISLFTPDWRTLWEGQITPESAGAVFTRPEVVDLILDLAGYRCDAGRLAQLRVLEPSCGDGAFVSRLVARLIESECAHASPSGWADPVLQDALRACDIDAAVVASTRATAVCQLVAAGCPAERATLLAQQWIIEADFLLEPWSGRYDVICGNPPYVRIEALPKAVLAQYRALYASMADRADVYVAFIERGLQLLSDAGRLAYIVANRWTRNQYGRTLRGIISEGFHVGTYLDLVHTQPFAQDVSAYPCIVVFDRCRGEPTHAATLDDITPATLDAVRHTVLPDGRGPHADLAGPVRRFDAWYGGTAPWVTTCLDEHERMTRMEALLPTLEESAPGTKVGIGVATGADRVFILPEHRADIEADRLLRLAMPSDVRNSGITWSGHWLINPFAGDGRLVELADYPGLRAWLEMHGDALRKRHVAKRGERTWYRTIDRVWPALLDRDKLLMRDIQDPSTPVVGVDVPGAYYPHHNLYHVTSDAWPLHALQCLLRSRRVIAQVAANSVAMRGGSVRWQAQVLRRVRLPALRSLRDDLLNRMTRAGAGHDTELIDAVADEAYATV